MVVMIKLHSRRNAADIQANSFNLAIYRLADISF